MENVYVVITIDIEEDGPEATVVVHGYANEPKEIEELVLAAIKNVRSDQEMYMLDDGYYDDADSAIEDGFLSAEEWVTFVGRFKDAADRALEIIKGGGNYFDLEFPHPKDGKTIVAVRPALPVRL